ncbi:MAG: hypothetical protein R3315_02665 [Woeseiaceae bacterium]|nr:hypothetical protein [Woeseiaceae bacterium]
MTHTAHCGVAVRLALALLGLVSALTWQSPAAAESNWSAERFQVFVGAPVTAYGEDTDRAAAEESEYLLFRPSQAAVNALQLAFNEAGEWFRENNFPEPMLRPVVQTDAGPAYRVYLCRASDGTCRTSAAGMYLRYCANETGRSEYLFMPIERAVDGDLVTEEGYQTLAHELTHAILSNTPYGQSIGDHCQRDSPEHWISEGIPDAIGYDLMDARWDGRYARDWSAKATVKRFGVRRYDERLPQHRYVDEPGQTCIETGDSAGQGCQTAGYTTSSFWHYIERVHGSELTYAFLLGGDGKPGLLDIPLQGRQSWERDVRWANQGLRSRLGYRLDFLYSLFIADFALRVAESKNALERLDNAGTPAAKAAAKAENLRRWLKALFPDGCEEVDLSLARPAATLPLTIKGMAAACVWVNPFNLPGLSQISFMAGHDDPSLLQDLSVVRAGSDIGVIGGAPYHVPNGPYQYYAAWKGFMHDGTERTLYVVTNFARQPTRSRQRSFELVVSLPETGNSALATVPLPPVPSALPKQEPTFERRSKSLAEQRAATADVVARQMELDKDGLSKNVDGAVELARRPNQPGCPEPFRYAPCGPHLQLNLQLTSGTWGMPAQTTGAGGQAAQFFGALSAMSSQIGSDVGQYIQDVEARLESIPGSFVGIRFPMIEYGFSGTFDNADITVNMDGGRPLQAIGPPDQSGQSPLTGQVTIEEYSPFRIAGTFTAPLAEFVPGGDGPPVYQRRETVSGTFNSVAPFLADERARPVQLSVQEVGEDVAGAFGLSPDVVDTLPQSGAPPAGGGQGGGIDARKLCDCDCAARPFVPEICHAACAEEYAACEN